MAIKNEGIPRAFPFKYFFFSLSLPEVKSLTCGSVSRGVLHILWAPRYNTMNILWIKFNTSYFHLSLHIGTWLILAVVFKSERPTKVNEWLFLKKQNRQYPPTLPPQILKSESLGEWMESDCLSLFLGPVSVALNQDFKVYWDGNVQKYRE